MQKKFTKKRKNLTAVHIVENEQHNNTLCGFISKNVEGVVLLRAQNGRSFSCRTPAAAAPLDIMRIMSGFFLYDQPQPFELLAVLRAGGHDIDAGRIYAAVP